MSGFIVTWWKELIFVINYDLISCLAPGSSTQLNISHCRWTKGQEATNEMRLG